MIEADVKCPTDAGLASAGVRTLARKGRKLAKLIGEKRRRVRDRSRSMGRRLRAISRTIRRRSGGAKTEVMALTGATGELLERSVREARRLAALARRKARGRGASAKLKAARQLEELADRCEKVAAQIKQRVAGEPITDRIVSLSDPDARLVPQGQAWEANRIRVRQPTGGGDRAHQARARGLLLPASSALGSRAENALLPQTVSELKRLGISPREVALDGGFIAGPTNSALADLAPKQVFIAGRQEPKSKRTSRRLRRYRTGAEGRISHLNAATDWTAAA